MAAYLWAFFLCVFAPLRETFPFLALSESISSARIRVIRGFFIRVIRVIRGCSDLIAAEAAPSSLRFHFFAYSNLARPKNFTA